MKFSEIIGHEMTKAKLERVIATGRPVNAYLFCGPEGIGKRMTALRFAAGLLCGADGARPCGVCPSCVKVETGNHPDLVTVAPEAGKKSISVDVIREVIADEVYVRPYLGARKIFYVPDGSLLGTAAQNALLKVLEEPPEYVVFLMAAHSGDIFLPTIRSRAQMVQFHPLAAADVEAYLNRNYPALGEAAGFVAAFSEGAIGRARIMAEDDTFFESRRTVNGYLQKLAGNDSAALYEFIHMVGAEKDAQAMLTLRFMVAWFRDALLMAAGEKNSVINRDMAYELTLFAQKVSKRAAASALDKLLALERQMKSNANMATASASAILNIWEGIHEESNRRAI